MRGLILAAMLCTFFSTPVWSDEKSISIGGMKITLGMSRELFESQIAQKPERFEIIEVEPGTIMIVSDRTKFGGHRYDPVGVIKYVDDKVNWVGKDWGSFGRGKILDFAEALHSVISNLNEQGRTLASVHVSTMRQPDYVINSITLSFANREVVISILSHAPPDVTPVSLQETLIER